MAWRIITNLPTVGADNDTWGDELNAAVEELDAASAKAADVYTKTETDGRYVRTINGTAPDASGNVAVAGGGGSGVPNAGSVTDASIAPGGLSPSKITGTAVTNGDSRLTNARTPTAHKASHATGGTDAIAPSDIGALATSSRGAASGVAPLGVDQKVPTANLPSLVRPGGNNAAFRMWVQATAPTVAEGAQDGDVWIPTA